MESKAKGRYDFKFEVNDQDFKRSGWCGSRPKCVMVAKTPDGVAVRDSKDDTKTTLFYTHDEWEAFVLGVKNNEF